MKPSELIAELHRQRLIAVLRSSTAEEALACAAAAFDAGIKFVEITLSVPGALGVIEKLARRGDLCVSGGTVLLKKQAEQAMDAGARLIVAPTLELDLISVCHRRGVPCVIGAATPTEVLTAARAGADLVKIFPADCLGGTHFVRQILGPLPDLRLLVSGGVELSNVKEYVELGVTGICLSSALLKKLYAEGGRETIVKQVREFVKVVEETVERSS